MEQMRNISEQENQAQLQKKPSCRNISFLLNVVEKCTEQFKNTLVGLPFFKQLLNQFY